MRFLILPVLLFALAFTAARAEVIPLEVLIKHRAPSEAPAARQRVDALAAAHGLKLIAAAPDSRLTAWRAPNAAALARFRAAARRDMTGAAPSIAAVWPHHRIHLDSFTVEELPANEPVAQTTALPGAVFPGDLHPLQWNLHNEGDPPSLPPDVDVDAPEAWAYAIGDRRIRVAIIDTGIQIGHPDLSPNIWINLDELPDNGIDDDSNGYIDDVLGYNFRDDVPDPDDLVGHGTAVAGIIGAASDGPTTDGATGIVGLNWQVSLMALNAFGSDTSTGEIHLIRAIDYAVANGAHIINASWGSNDYPPAMAESVRRAVDDGLLFVASAGNNGFSLDQAPQYPAAFDFPRILAVGAFEREDKRSRSSSYGHARVHVMAPGRRIYTTWLLAQYRSVSGTSFAAPHASGLAALLLSAHPEIKLGGPGADWAWGKIIGGTEPQPRYSEDAIARGRLNARQPLERDESAIPPVGDLRVGRLGFNGAVLRLTVPGDPNAPAEEAPTLYDVRVALKRLDTDDAFFSVPRAPDLPLPAAPATTQTIALLHLDPATTYCVGLRTLDAWGNYSEASNLVSFATLPAPPAVFADDAETSHGAWALAEGDWHRTTETARLGAWSWTMRPDGGDYPPNENIALVSGPIDLSGVARPLLEFHHRHIFAASTLTDSDGGHVEISLDGGAEWIELAGFYDWEDEWHREQILMRGAGGRAGVRLRFRFQSFTYAFSQPLGWFIDDVKIMDAGEWGEPQTSNLSFDIQVLKGRSLKAQGAAKSQRDGAEPWVSGVKETQGWRDFCPTAKIMTAQTPAWITAPRRRIFSVWERFYKFTPEPTWREAPPGQWLEVAPRTPMAGVWHLHPPMSRATMLADGPEGRGTYAPWLPAPGRYAVYMAWGPLANARRVKLLVRHAFGAELMHVDQNGPVNGDRWHKLGEFLFYEGQNANRCAVTIDKATTDGPADPSFPGAVHFDLLRFDLLEEGNPQDFMDGDIPIEGLEGSTVWFNY